MKGLHSPHSFDFTAQKWLAHPRDAIIPVPFRSRLIHGLEPGQTLISHGTVHEHAKNFELNLLCGSSALQGLENSVALHVKACFDTHKIVINSLENGEWNKHEKHVKNPFKAGDPFDLRIRIHGDRYEILVNQKEVAELEHRIPLNAVDHIEVKGDIKLDSYHQLPFERTFHDGHLKAGEIVLIYGTPTGSDRFDVDFLGRDGQILFHLSIRLHEKKVVRNAQINGEWGVEEREGAFPFKKDLAFDLVIQNQPYSIQIFINNKRYATFAHRVADPRHEYHAIRITGDVDLTGLGSHLSPSRNCRILN
ncbi:Galectin [Aphelenchoides bicaudatus]|nr:Galectin [Aphelenchoides bicaudatus]